MPLPRYIICARDRIVDQSSGLVSYINVIEKVTAHGEMMSGIPEVHQEKIAVALGLKLFASAAWMQDEADESREYEFEFLLRHANGETDTLKGGQFTFNRRFHRIDLQLTIANLKSQDDGFLTIICQIKPSSSSANDWIAQEYPIALEVHMSKTEGSTAHK
jgi:hypothetical protein